MTTVFAKQRDEEKFFPEKPHPFLTGMGLVPVSCHMRDMRPSTEYGMIGRRHCTPSCMHPAGSTSSGVSAVPPWIWMENPTRAWNSSRTKHVLSTENG